MALDLSPCWMMNLGDSTSPLSRSSKFTSSTIQPFWSSSNVISRRSEANSPEEFRSHLKIADWLRKGESDFKSRLRESEEASVVLWKVPDGLSQPVSLKPTSKSPTMSMSGCCIEDSNSSRRHRRFFELMVLTTSSQLCLRFLSESFSSFALSKIDFRVCACSLMYSSWDFDIMSSMAWELPTRRRKSQFDLDVLSLPTSVDRYMGRSEREPSSFVSHLSELNTELLKTTHHQTEAQEGKTVPLR